MVKRKKKRSELVRFLIWFFYEFLGIRAIKEKIRPPKDPQTGKRKPPTFFLWFITIYVAFFGIARQNYESKLSLIKNRISPIIAKMASDRNKEAFGLIPLIQKMKCPVKPEILKAHTIFSSFFGNEKTHHETVDQLKEIVVINKRDLERVILTNANLSGANLYKANLICADLSNSNLVGADLTEAFLTGTICVNADLSNVRLNSAYCHKANFNGAILNGANFQNSDLSKATFLSSDLSEAELRNAKNLTIYQLSKVKTLYKAQLEPDLEKQVKEEYPHLLEKPKEEK